MAFDPQAFIENQPQTFDQDRRKRTDDTGTFDPAAFLASGEPPAPQTAMAAETPGAAPAFVVSGPTGINPQAIRQATQPLIDIIPRTYQQYMAPGGAVKAGLDLLGVGTVGVPPVAAIETARAVAALPGAVRQAGQVAVDLASSVPEALRAPWMSAADKLRPEDFRRLAQLAQDQGVAGWKSFDIPDYLDDASRNTIRQIQASVPSGMQALARMAGPALRGAAKVAGPAGLAYDIYQAQPYMAQGGQELQSGAAAERMRAARRSQLNAPTPAPLTTQEAQNLYESGDQRLMDIYRQDQELASLIRRRAAEKVLAPMAP